MHDESVFYAHFGHFAQLGVAVAVAAVVLNALFLSTEWNEFRGCTCRTTRNLATLHWVVAPDGLGCWLLHVLLHLASGFVALSKSSFWHINILFILQVLILILA